MTIFSKLALGALSLALLFHSTSAPGASSAKKDSLEDLSRDAYIWGYPAVLLSRTRQAMLAKTSDPKESVNHFFSSKKTPDAIFKDLSPTNAHTLFMWAWLDVSKEPLVLTSTELQNRYYAFQFVDAYSNVFHVLNSNQNKSTLYVITAPNWKGTLPANAQQLQATTPEVFLMGQIYVKDTAEIAQVQKQTAQYQLIPLSDWNNGVKTDAFKATAASESFKVIRNLAVSGPDFISELQKIVAKNSPTQATDRKEYQRFFALGLEDKSLIEKNRQDPEAQKMIEKGLFQGEREIESRLAAGQTTKVNGWAYEIKYPAFHEDLLLRAAVAKRSLFSTPIEEMVQLTQDTDEDGNQLFGNYRYVLHFEFADLPSAESMWSLRIGGSEQAPYAISTMNSKMKYNNDGSLDIVVQTERPAKSLEGNWLKTPANGNFSLLLTVYNPGNLIMNRKYAPPSVLHVEDGGVPKQRITRTMMAWRGLHEFSSLINL